MAAPGRGRLFRGGESHGLRITACGFANPKRRHSGCAFDSATAVTEREGWAMGQTRDGKAVAPLPSATAVTEPGMDRAPSDEQREERCVNPLLCACNGLRAQEKRLPGQPYAVLLLLLPLWHLPANA